jgi:hypothetical protein
VNEGKKKDLEMSLVGKSWMQRILLCCRYAVDVVPATTIYLAFRVTRRSCAG